MNQVCSLQVEINVRKDLLHAAWEKCVQYQEEYGQEKSNLLKDNVSPKLDMIIIRRSLEEKETVLAQLRITEKSMRVKLEEVKKNIFVNQEKAVVTLKRATDLEVTVIGKIDAEKNTKIWLHRSFERS